MQAQYKWGIIKSERPNETHVRFIASLKRDTEERAKEIGRESKITRSRMASLQQAKMETEKIEYNMEAMEVLKRMRTTLGLNRRSRGEWRTNPTLTYLARSGPPQSNRAWLIRGQAGNGVSQRNWVTVGLIYSARDLEIGRRGVRG